MKKELIFFLNVVENRFRKHFWVAKQNACFFILLGDIYYFLSKYPVVEILFFSKFILRIEE